jgi:hypothetical protein
MGSYRRTVVAFFVVGAVLAAGVVGAAPTQPASAAIPAWSPLGPAPRSDASMAYDPGLARLVLFGGSNSANALLADTWTTNGTTWTEAAPTTSPSARSDAAMAYDPATNQLVLFGGLSSTNAALGDTWVYNGTTWTALTPAASPPARSFASMAYDSATNQLVLFGGLSSAGTPLSDTWTFDGTTWTQATPAASPLARSDASMAYDAATNHLVLFGGLSTPTTTLADTWTFDGTTWAQATPAASPPARSDASMAYDAATNQLVLVSGLSTPAITLSDIWTFDGTNWAQASPPTAPQGRSNAVLAYDAATSELVLLGGNDASANTLGDTWLSNGINWVPSTPPPRSDYATADDPALGGVVLFGGLSSTNAALGDTWLYDGTTWVQQVPTVSPAARSFASMAYDSATNQLVLFGGLSSTNAALGDTWVYNGTTWTALSPPISPDPRSDTSLTYDPTLGKLVLFGGLDANSNTLSDTWTFNGTTWTPMGPSARSDEASAYDSATNQLVLFGGSDVNGNTLGDTWVESGSTWTQVPTPATLGARSNASMCYDATLGKVVLFGGINALGTTLSDTWVFDGTSWSQIAPLFVPPARSDASLVYDSALGEPVLFGGLNTGTTRLSDVWTLVFAHTWQKVAVGTLVPQVRSDASMSYDSASNRVVLFGGLSATNGALNDTWVLSLTSSSQGKWTPFAPAVSPPARSFASMAYDPSTNQSVLLGGVGAASTIIGDEWTWNFATANWTAQTSVALPSARSDSSMVYNPAANRLVLFGGLDPTINTLGDTWTSSGTAWVAQTPPARSDASSAFDTAANALVLFGGLDVNSGALGDTWSFTGTAWIADATSSAPSARSVAAMAYDPNLATLLLFGGTDNTLNTLGDEWTFSSTAPGSGTWTALTPSVLPSARSDASLVFDNANAHLVLFGGLDVTGSSLDDTWTIASTVAQSVTFTSSAPSAAVVGGPTYTPTASATSGLAVTISLDSSSTGCSLSGGVVTFTAVGTCLIDANQAGNANYLPAPQVQQSITVAQQSQAITFTPPVSATVGGTATLTASGGASGNPVVFTVDPSSGAGVCSVSGVDGTTVSYQAVGTCLIDANQAGSTNYLAAPQVQRSITVTQGTQSITFAAPAPGTVGGTAILTASGGASGNPVVFTVDPLSGAGVCSVSGTNGTTVSYAAIGTCLLDANQAGSSNYLAAPQVLQSVAVSAVCSPGYYSATGMVPCTLAPVGTYVPTPGSTAPTKCPSGTYTLAPGATSATACVKLTIGGPGARRNYVFAPLSAPAPTTVNGVGALTWSGSGFPTGLVISPATGTMSGTPTTPCTCSVTLVATDGSGHSGSTTFLWTILPFGVATTSLPTVTPGAVYGPVRLVAGGVTPSATLKWTKGAALPHGLKLTSAGVLFGTSSVKLQPGTAVVVVGVTETVISLVGTKRVKTKTTVRSTVLVPIA